MNKRQLLSLAFLLGPITALGATPVGQLSQFRADSSLVLVGATVEDTHDRPVRGLTRQDFRLFSDKVEQTIRYFGEEDVPLSLAVVFDTSGSMSGKLDSMRGALAAVLGTANPEDEFSLITFADHPQIAVPWTRDAGQVQNHVLAKPAHGRTALLDAIALGLQLIRQAHNPRRAIVVFSDGGDNYSRFSERALARQLEETDVQLYAIDTSDFLMPPANSYAESAYEPPQTNLLSSLCDGAAGQYFQISNARDPERIAEQISLELRSQYVLGFSPSTLAGDGKFHRLQLKVQSPSGAHLLVHWRRGYRAPVN